jgi:hypothetical protein
MNTASIFPFARPLARTFPHCDLASVEVKHATAGSEPGVDWFREARIRVLSRAYTAAVLADDRASLRRLWDSLCAAIASRSPDVVARMERARGLR